MRTTEQMIDELVVAIAGPIGAPRKVHYLKTSLQLLVRMAKDEYAVEMKRSVALAVGEVVTTSDKTKSKAVARKLLASLQSKQSRLDLEPGGFH